MILWTFMNISILTVLGSINLKCNVDGLRRPGTTIERSLKNSGRQDHVILGGVVICIHGWRGHAPPAETKEQGVTIRGPDSVPLCCATQTADQFGKQANPVTPPPPAQLETRIQSSGEKLVAWEHLWMAAVCCWVRIMGLRPRQSVQPPLLQAGRWR